MKEEKRFLGVSLRFENHHTSTPPTFPLTFTPLHTSNSRWNRHSTCSSSFPSIVFFFPSFPFFGNTIYLPTPLSLGFHLSPSREAQLQQFFLTLLTSWKYSTAVAYYHGTETKHRRHRTNWVLFLLVKLQICLRKASQVLKDYCNYTLKIIYLFLVYINNFRANIQ